ncbi:MAG TPA: DUF2970 domain-containing protein [Burkholderiales bacterium]|jgi:hypothetical protein|nr:DUF2970 domain-containing protein [Burkholderiales bacterium]
MSDPAEEPAVKKAGVLAVAKTVFWSFFGIRRRKEHEQDIARLTLKQVVIAGIVGGVLFVLTLVLIVRLVISQAAA